MRRLVKSLLLAFAIMLVAASALAVMLVTEGGRRLIAGFGSAVASRAAGLDIVIEDLRQPRAWQVEIGRLTVAAREQPIAEAADIRIDWSWDDLSRFDFRPRALTLARIELRGLPPDDGTPAGTGLPSLQPPYLPAGSLSVDRILVDPAVLGERLALSLAASERHAAGGPWLLDLALKRIDRPSDAVAANIGYGGSGGSLHVEARITEAAGGLLGRRLGPAAGDLDLRLVGEGPAASWRGRLSALLQGVGGSEATLTLAVGEGVDAAIEGTASVENLTPDPGAVDYRAQLHWFGADAVEIRSASFEAAIGALALQGRVDRTLIDLAGTLRLADLTLIEPMLSGRAAAAFRAHGPFASLDITADLDSALSVREAVRVGSLRARATIGLRPDGIVEAGLSGDLDDIGDLPAALAPLVGSSARFEVRARRDKAGGIRVDRFAATAALVDLDGAADLNTTGGESTAHAKASLRDLSPLGSVAGVGLGGRAEARLQARGDLAAGVARADGAVVFSDLGVDEPHLAALLGRAPRIDLAVRGEADGKIHVESMIATTADGDVRISGDIDTVARTLALAIGAQVRDIAPLAAGAARGALRLDGRLTGSFDRLALAGQADLRGAAVAGLALPRGSASFNIVNLTGDATGRLQADLGFTEGRVTLASDLSYAGRRLLMARRIALAGPGVTLGGELRYDMIRNLAEGALDLRSASLRPAARLAGVDLDGRAEGTFRFDSPGGKQRVTARVDAAALNLADLTLARAGLSGSVGDIFGTPALKLELEGADLVRGEHKVETIRAALQGTPKAFRFTADSAGKAGHPFRLSLAGTGGIDAAAWRLGLDRLSVRYAEIPVDLRRPLVASGDRNGFRLAPAEFSVDRGSLTAEGRRDGERVAANLRLEGIPAALAQVLRPDLKPEGRLGADLHLAGTTANPEGSLTLRAEGLRTMPDLPALSLESRADLAGNRLCIDGRMTGAGDQPLLLKAELPAALRLQPFDFSLPSEGAVAGELSGPIDLDRVLGLILPGEDQISGTATVKASVQGTAAAPRASGWLRLTGGRYVNGTSEAVINDLSLALEAEERRLTFKGGGQDGSGGSVVLSGSMDLDPRARFPLAATLSLRDFRAARRDDAAARLTADLSLGPDLATPKLSGEIKVVEAELRIPDRLPPNVVVLDVREINRPDKDAAPPKPAAPLALGLDLRISAPNRIFVRGRGLDSEFGGALSVRGDSRQPQIAGGMKMVRGTLDLLGKRLTLESGSLTFAGGSRIDPDIAVVATFPAGNTTGEVSLSGTLSAPALKLGSRSGLPQDEVLSRLLFGTGTASLTPLQALQLAQSAATLVGATPGGGPLEELRRRVGLDRLDVQGGTGTEGPNVEVGKYLAPNILLKAQQGTGAGGPTVGVEVEVTPNISVDTRVAPDAKSSIGVNLKKDY